MFEFQVILPKQHHFNRTFFVFQNKRSHFASGLGHARYRLLYHAGNGKVPESRAVHKSVQLLQFLGLVLYEMLHFVPELVQWMGRNVNAVDFFLPLQYQQRIGLGNIRDRGFFQNGIAGFSEKGSLAAAGIVLEILAVAADFFQIRLSVFFEKEVAAVGACQSVERTAACEGFHGAFVDGAQIHAFNQVE